jgi:acyl-CoA dehydrogenase
MLWFFLFFIFVVFLSYHRTPLLIYTLAIAAFLGLWMHFSPASVFVKWPVCGLFILLALIFNIKYIRRLLITRYIMAVFSAHRPKISTTEKIALEAGSVGWEGQLFSGKPKWRELEQLSLAKLSNEELNFIHGPVMQLCAMVNDWEITHVHADLPEEIWKFIKEMGFFGLIIPKEYGGKAFSAYAHSEIISILATCSFTLATTVTVPNSLGPAELLIKYGTPKQRQYYLPKLANGEEVPCFALTGIRSGSDATNMFDIGIVCKDMFEGKEILGIRLNFHKRYITLAPVATVIGLAFKLYDPDQLLGQKEYIGISLALLPVTIANLQIGRRHFPMNCVFQNGPVSGENIFIPFEYLIGGQEMMGHGWRMLVECLSIGRAISLPALALGSSKAATLASGAYCRIREQFGQPIGYFEGIQEKLALMGGLTYLMEAARQLVLAEIANGEEPAIESGMLKYYLTEMGRQIVMAAMDVHGGKGICLGSRNYLGRPYQSAPIAITVEGANILTRSMIIFGQGALRCHPYLLKEIESLNIENKKLALKQFDTAFFHHVGLIGSNKVRSFLLGLTNGRLSHARKGPTKRYYQKLTRFSAAFAYLADVCIVIFGANLKKMERISARLADILSMLFIGSAILKRFDAHHQPADELPLLHWSCQYIFAVIERSIDEILANYPYRWVGRLLRIPLLPFGRHSHGPGDKLSAQVAELLLTPSVVRSRLSQDVYCGERRGSKNPQQLLEEALLAIINAAPIESRVRHAMKKSEHVPAGMSIRDYYPIAHKEKIITDSELAQLIHADDLRLAVLAVDDFDQSELARS